MKIEGASSDNFNAAKNTDSPAALLEQAEQAIEPFAKSLIGFHTQVGDARKTQILAQLQQAQLNAPSNGKSTADNPLGFLLAPTDARAAGLFKAGGAYFNKQMAVHADAYKSIQQQIKLPTMTFDPNRFYVPRASNDSAHHSTMLERINNYQTSPLDKPSFYLGGSTTINKNVKGEMDVGLTLDRVYNKNGEATFTTNSQSSDMRNPADRFTVKIENGFYVARNENGSKQVRASVKDVDAQLAENLKPNADHTNKAVVLKIGDLELRPNFAFRPTERTINIKPGEAKTDNQWYNPPKDAAGLAAARNNGLIANENDSKVQNKYYYPGETLKMSLSVAGKDKANLTLESTDGDAAKTYSHDFKQQGVGDNQKWQPKTVISIDQFTVDSQGHRVGCEYNGDTPQKNVKRKDGGIYNQGVQPTQAKLENAQITSSTLTDAKGKFNPVAGKGFYEVRSNELRDHNYKGIFEVHNADPKNGAKTLNITPSNIKNK